MKKFECWRLESVGLDRNIFVARFATESAAVDAGAAAGGYGPAVSKELIEIWNDCIEWKPDLFDKDAKESGLAKLSQREKVALGLEEGANADET